MTDKFMEALEAESVRPMDQWEYIGGNFGKHAAKFFEINDSESTIPHSHQCICSKPITDNCYIKNTITGKILVVGVCCIKPFTHKTCKSCGSHHKQKSDLCRPCKIRTEYKECGGKTVLRSGKYKGHTFKQVLRKDQEYCVWVLDNRSTDASLILFKKWLNR